VAHVLGDAENRGIPEIMITYRSGGTPWKVVIDRSGTVVYNSFHIEVEKAVSLIKQLTRVGNK